MKKKGPVTSSILLTHHFLEFSCKRLNDDASWIFHFFVGQARTEWVYSPCRYLIIMPFDFASLLTVLIHPGMGWILMLETTNASFW
jgi:hypothetical protein